MPSLLLVFGKYNVLTDIDQIPTSRQDHKSKQTVPETQKVEEGSARRNIVRKHDHDPNRYVGRDLLIDNRRARTYMTMIYFMKHAHLQSILLFCYYIGICIY
jgi:hypothetical protein